MKRARALAAALAAAALVAGCGERDDAAPSAAATAEAEPVGSKIAGSVAQYADCDDWRGGTRDERMATIADIRGQHTPQNSTTAESPLSDEEAYEIFEGACAEGNPGSLRLYKLYVRAQGFAPLQPD